jgi:hypothetical protein
MGAIKTAGCPQRQANRLRRIDMIQHIGQSDLTQLSTWYEAAAIEPRLLDLEAAVASYRLDGDHPDFWRHYRDWKTQLEKLVGWFAQNPALRHSRFFDSCQDHLFSIYERGQV